MPQPVKTRWHKLVSLVKEDEVYLTAPTNLQNETTGTSAHWDEYDPNKTAMNWLLNQFGELPKFVIDSELLELVMREGYEHSLVAMKKAGVLRLPFPAMIVEFDYVGRRYLVMLRDQAATDTKFDWEPPLDPKNADDVSFSRLPFYGITFRIEHDPEGEYAVVSPSVQGVNVDEKDGVPFVGLSAQGLEIFPQSEKFEELVKSTWFKDGSALYRAVASAMLVMHTKGVKHETIECSRLNKHRVASNRPPIPRHIVLSIGKVYRSSTSDVADNYDPRKSPRPHWRRGYDQPVHYGVGRAKLKLVYVEPKLVAFHGSPDEAPKPSGVYIVKK